MEAPTSFPVYVRARFILPTSDDSPVDQTFDEANCDYAHVGLPEGVAAKKPEAGDFSYSGMHDHGPLPPPKEGGAYALLIGCVNKAKQESDDLLTSIIQSEKSQQNRAGEAAGSSKGNSAGQKQSGNKKRTRQ